MVSDFFPELDQTEIGKKAGFLGSAYYIGCLGGSFMVSSVNNKSLNSCQPLQWGWVGDIVGRRYCIIIAVSNGNFISFFFYRPALLFCICSIIVNFTLFGFSQNFAWAVCSRLLWGLLDGVLGLSKTYISEVCLSCVSSLLVLPLVSLYRYVMRQIKVKVLL